MKCLERVLPSKGKLPQRPACLLCCEYTSKSCYANINPVGYPQPLDHVPPQHGKRLACQVLKPLKRKGNSNTSLAYAQEPESIVKTSDVFERDKITVTNTWLPFGKLTWQWKITFLKVTFHCYVSLPEGITSISSQYFSTFSVSQHSSGTDSYRSQDDHDRYKNLRRIIALQGKRLVSPWTNEAFNHSATNRKCQRLGDLCNKTLNQQYPPWN